MAEFHFLRPWWWLAVIPMLGLLYRLSKHQLVGRDWQGVVDEALAPFVLDTIGKTEKNKILPWFGVICVMMILALSGPVWEQLDVPVYRAEHKVVLVLDLSLSMNAEDVKPSRLERAKHKVSDVLSWSPDAQVGLVVFSEVPFTISPITDDVDTIAAFLPALTTDVMPIQGSRISLALDMAGELLDRSNAKKGQVVLITDSEVRPDAFTSVKRLSDGDYSLSILGIGTEKGSPVLNSDGSLLKATGSGGVVLTKLDKDGLRDLASGSGGVYSDITSDDTDIKRLIDLTVDRQEKEQSDVEMLSEQWVERSPWLLPFVLLIALLMFRRGTL